MRPALGPELVADVEARQRVTLALAGETGRDGRAELDGVLVAQLEERAEAPGHERLADLAAAERGLVVAVERRRRGPRDRRAGPAPR